MKALRLVAVCATVAAASACAPVASIGKRLDDGAEARVDRLAVYSFLPMHPSGSERWHREAVRLDESLGDRLRDEHFDTVVADVEAIAREHGLPVEVAIQQVGDGIRTTGILPERGVLAANRAVERDSAATHRLVLFPARMTIARPSGVTSGVIHWRLEHVTDERPVAHGAMRFIADARGFPDQRMARQLVADLKRLQIH